MVGELFCVEEFGSHDLVMGGRMMLGQVVSFVGGAGSPVNDELVLEDSVPDPVEAHVDGFAALVLDGPVGKSHGGGVVNFNGGRWLRVAHFFEGDANWACFSGVEEGGTDFRFHGRAHDDGDDFGEGVDDSVGWGIGVGGQVWIFWVGAEVVDASSSAAGVGNR